MTTPGELPDVLHHFTCNHGLVGIAADQSVKPNPHPLLGHALVWLTDLDVPDRLGLGLTSVTLKCDRSVHRVDVRTSPHVQWWPTWAHAARMPSLTRDMLEGGGALPAHWYVSPVALPVLAIHARAARAVAS